MCDIAEENHASVSKVQVSFIFFLLITLDQRDYKGLAMDCTYAEESSNELFIQHIDEACKW